MNNLRKNEGITLIALVVTIVVLIILARNKYSNINRRKWIIKKRIKCQRKNRNSRRKRNIRTSNSASDGKRQSRNSNKNKITNSLR